MNNYELIKFKDDKFVLDVNVSPKEETVWLTQDQIGILFNRHRSVISKHIINIYKEKELDIKTSRAKFAQHLIDRFNEEIFEFDESSTCAKFSHMGSCNFIKFRRNPVCAFFVQVALI